MFKPRFLVLSIGNPLPKYPSLHSAGHFALNGLAKQLAPMHGALDGQTALKETTLGRQKCLALHHEKYTLVQSPTLMNVSGSFVLRAWKEFVGQQDPSNLSLVIVHDELERTFGDVRLVEWGRSARGHNGMKSIKASLSQSQWPVSPLARIAVGIGRPEQRDSASVSKFVLRKITEEQRQVLEGEVSTQVAAKLGELEDEWRAELEK